MAKISLVAFVLAALLATGFAAEHSRALQQASTYTCSQAVALQGTGCADMLKCLSASPQFKSLATPANLRLFQTSCTACAAATKACPKDNSLPAQCKAGLSVPPVLACVQKLAPAAKAPVAKAAAKPAAKPSPKPAGTTAAAGH